MFCKNCGTKLDDQDKFCYKCGGPITNDIHAHSATNSNTFKKANTESPPLIKNESSLKPYYVRVFRQFDENPTAPILSTWNWAACIFGFFWYLSKGLRMKALLMFVAFVFLSRHGLGSLSVFIIALYCGIFGNRDYYLLKRKNTQLWNFQREN